MDQFRNSSQRGDSESNVGPYILVSKGTWGTGRHSTVEVDEAGVTDLSRPPDADPDGCDYESTFVFEDVEPAIGLDITLGSQELAVVLGADGRSTWEVRDA